MKKLILTIYFQIGVNIIGLPEMHKHYLLLKTEKETPNSKSGEVVKKEMTYREWRGLKKQSGFVYLAYQKNFSQFN